MTSKQEPNNGVGKVIEINDGTHREYIAVNTRTGELIPAEKICQFCGKILEPFDLFDYICNKCELEH